MVRERADGRVHLDDLFAAVTPRTRMIAISHVEYASGFRTDLAAIGEFCRTHKAPRGTCGTDKILFCVDAIQSIGGAGGRAGDADRLPLRRRAQVDDGPGGLGIFFCRRELLDSLQPEVGSMNVINATNYTSFDFTLRPDARRFECGGYNIAGVLGLGAALQLLTDVGMPTVGARLYALTELLAEGVRKKGYTVYSPRRRKRSGRGLCRSSRPRGRCRRMQGYARRWRSKTSSSVDARQPFAAQAPHFYQGETQINALLNALPAH